MAQDNTTWQTVSSTIRINADYLFAPVTWTAQKAVKPFERMLAVVDSSLDATMKTAESLAHGGKVPDTELAEASERAARWSIEKSNWSWEVPR